MPDYLTTRELADLLRIGERKVYDLAANGEVPCVRAVGKLLFPQGMSLHLEFIQKVGKIRMFGRWELLLTQEKR